MTGLIQDVRYALRQLRKSPGFTAVTILTLTLGIGANTAIFSVIETVLLRPLPFREPDRLIWLNGKVPQTDEAGVSPADFLDYRAANRSFQQLAGVSQVVMAGPASLSGDKPEQVITNLVSAGFFETLGIRPLLGRDFKTADEQVNTSQSAILGYGIWKRDFDGDRNIVGRTIRLDGQNLMVIGVLPSDLPLLSQAQIWTPTPMLHPMMRIRGGHFFRVIGRLKPGVTTEQAQSDLDAIAAQLARQYPDIDKGWSLRQRPLRDVLVGPVRPALLLMWGAVGLLLLIACVNVANLLLARSILRQKEFALRAALGASRGRMIRQALTESVLLSLGGGALGVLAATVGIHALRTLGSLNVPRLNETEMDPGVLAFTVCISLLTGIVFGLVPTLQISGSAFSQGLRESSRTSAPPSHKRVSSALVIGEIAMSLTLLVSAGLLIKSFWLTIHVNPGFQTQHVLTARLGLNGPAYADAAHRVRFWQEFEERVANLPGVEAVGATSELPLSGEHSDGPFHIPGHIYGPSEFDDAFFRQVTPSYLAAMRIPLFAGRWLDQRDTANSPGTILVNQAFAKRYFPDQDVLGKRLQLLGDLQPDREIVGVVGNISHTALTDPQQPEMYVAYAQYAPPTMNLVVRAAANPEPLAAALYETVRAIDKDETLSAIRSMGEVVGASVSQPRFSSQLLGVFATLAVLLAAIGLYGLMAYSVTQRRNEIGIRMALGATREEILRLVLRHGSILALAGMGFGLGASMIATRVLSSMLFAVSPTDPQTFLAVALLLAGVALGACLVPARRAMKLDPMVALRYE
jgi:putative ABC transport system permease protein